MMIHRVPPVVNRISRFLLTGSSVREGSGVVTSSGRSLSVHLKIESKLDVTVVLNFNEVDKGMCKMCPAEQILPIEY